MVTVVLDVDCDGHEHNDGGQLNVRCSLALSPVSARTSKSTHAKFKGLDRKQQRESLHSVYAPKD